jgi:CelD/BcsL family acetyltransferase involved in cellulose biosynthesis
MHQSVSLPPVYRFDPLRDPRWTDLIERHPRASAFHLPAWLDALQRTYGYEPVGLTTAPPGTAFRNGVVFCRVRSWLTGQRLVSLPFSDHCQPLVDSEEELKHLMTDLDRDRDVSKWKYAELRPIDPPRERSTDLETAESFCFHRLDLRPTLEDLFRRFHKSCVQRKIRRAEREHLACEEGRSETLLQKFYELNVLTRRRLHVPPQPLAWFRNLITGLGDKLTIWVASKDGQAVASILTLRYKDTLVYKYGCSDRRFSNLGGMQLLFWRAIENAKRDGLSEFDLGRSDWVDEGLIDFKDRWGAARSELTYLRHSPQASRSRAASLLQLRMARQVAAFVPDSVVISVGRTLYRHLG